jgi:probable rRNA maturation factor
VLSVVLLNRQRRRRVAGGRLTRLLQGAASALGVSGEVALVLTGDRALRGLNARYRGKDKPTDVLSFPGPAAPRKALHSGGSRRGAGSPLVEGEGDLGDIVVSLDSAARNARALGRTLSSELDILALHGFLHLMGHDHETDDGEMLALQAEVLESLR